MTASELRTLAARKRHSQATLAAALGRSPATIRSWWQGRRQIPEYVVPLLGTLPARAERPKQGRPPLQRPDEPGE